MRETALKPSRSVTFRLSLPCELAEVRPSAVAVRRFLSEQGLHEEELMDCELALTEACNNAIQHVSPKARREPVEIAVTCNDSKIELRVNDHTAGFRWPERAQLPEPECERGRGLFLIQCLMDSTGYFRGQHENSLVMRKTRCHHGRGGLTQTATHPDDLSRKLAESEHTLREMARELSFSSESLAAIFRCSAELGRTNDLAGFSQRLLSDLLHITAADWFVLRLVPRDELRLAVFAVSEPDLELDPIPMPAAGPATQYVEIKAALARRDVWFDRNQPLDDFDPLAAVRPNSIGLVCPLFLDHALIGTLAVGRSRGLAPFTAAQAEVVRTLGDFLALEIVNARLHEEKVNLRLVSRELEIARNIQRALLPKSLPQLRGYGLAGFCESAEQVGGDFYDVLQLSDRSMLLVVADVMGKGVPAALFAAILRSLIRAMPEWGHQPSELLARVNRQMFEELSEVDMFITAQLVFVDLKNHCLTTASAGHWPVLVARGKDEVTTLSPDGMPLGILPTTAFSDETIKLGRDSRVLLYTDGITGVCNASGKQFSQERLKDWLEQTLRHRGTAEQMKQELVAELAQFQTDIALKDDQTFLLLAEEHGHGPTADEHLAE